MTMLYQILCYNKVCYKETALYLLINSDNPNKYNMYKDNVTECTNTVNLVLVCTVKNNSISLCAS